MLKLAIAVTATLLIAIPSVSAHGYVQEITSGSAKYTGYLPYTDPYYNPVPQRIVRQIPGNGRYLILRISHLLVARADWFSNQVLLQIFH